MCDDNYSLGYEKGYEEGYDDGFIDAVKESAKNNEDYSQKDYNHTFKSKPFILKDFIKNIIDFKKFQWK